MDRRGFISSIFGAMASASIFTKCNATTIVETKPVVANDVNMYSPVPTNYPLQICGGVVDRAYLVPFHHTLYDSEILPMLVDDQWCRGYPDTNKIRFFCRPLSFDFAFYSKQIVKELDSTNLNQSSMLDYPREFSVTGIGLFLENGISEEDKNAIINNSHLEFIYHGNRCLYDVPLMLMPKVCSEDQLNKLIEEETPVVIGNDKFLRTQRIKDGFYPIDIKYKAIYNEESLPVFKNHNINECFMLKPGECFGVNLNYSKPPSLSKPIKIMVALDGYLWQPM